MDQLQAQFVNVSTGHSGKNEKTAKCIHTHTLAAIDFLGNSLGDNNLTLIRGLTKSDNLAAFERRTP
jgi:hypothetical protein